MVLKDQNAIHSFSIILKNAISNGVERKIWEVPNVFQINVSNLG